MKISLEWLSDFLVWKEKDPERIAARLTASTGEVEEVEVQGAHLRGCCVGKLLTLQKHPNADRLSLCSVQTDQGVKRVVCGGTNLRKGMRVAFAHVGTVVAGPDGEPLLLQKAKIRGEESEGMICSSPELKCIDRFPMKPEQGGRPVIDLGDGVDGVGLPLSEYLGLNDVVLHIDNHAITHRPDLFSHKGVARECVALGLATWKKISKPKAAIFPRTPLSFELLLEQKKLVPRYFGCMVHIGALGETPAWMRRRLEAMGGRSLHLPVDITNYVMWECGTPLHSFDADDLQGSVHVRASREGEKILTLDNVERVLPAGAVVMSDDRGIFDLLGVMGGLRSSMKPHTRHIYLQSPVVDPVAIRTAIIGTGHRTEAATIFEKGVPPIAAKEGFERALELFLALVPGAQITSKLVSWGSDGKPRPIAFSAKDAERGLGVAVPEKAVKRIFANLGFKVSRSSVTPPLWRVRDITGPHDLVEEVGRIVGYDRIVPKLPEAAVEAPPRDPRIHALREGLWERGFVEVLPLSLVGPALLSACRLHSSEAFPVLNALGEELSLMQTSTLPRLLEHASKNMLLSDDLLKTFQCAHVFSQDRGEWAECGMLVAARRETPLLSSPFLQVKQSLLDACSGMGFAVEIHSAKTVPSFGHPGRSADIVVGGVNVGILCEVHPEVRAAFGLPDRAAIVLLNLTILLAQASQPSVYSPPPQFPAITYDLTVTLDASRALGKLLGQIRSSSALLEEVAVADLYEGSSLGSGQYNLTVRCTYRAQDRTLTEEEVKREHEKVEKAMVV